jgi:preprotein translocase subunit YajC
MAAFGGLPGVTVCNSANGRYIPAGFADHLEESLKMLISPAYAQAAAAPSAGGLEAFLPLILIFVVFYFLLIRPQQKKAKQHRDMLQALRRGDRVLTGGGIIGTVVKLEGDTEVTVEIADNVKVRVLRATIQDVLSKTQPVAGSKEDGEGEGKPQAKAGGLKGLLGGKDK